MFSEMASSVGLDAQAGGAGGLTTLEDLRRLDKAWTRVRTQPTGDAAGPAPVFVKNAPSSGLGEPPQYDVVVCGGTLGIFLATALQLRGLKVAVLERGELRGRAQEWNISRKELDALTDLGIMTPEQVEQAVAKEFNPVRVGFKGSEDIWMRDVLNLGVQPDFLIRTAAARFKSAGGDVLDCTAASGITVHDDGVGLDVGQSGARRVTARLVLDCMGHASPIVRQIRHGTKPDGVCCVVGSLAAGFDTAANSTSDVIYTNTDIEPVDKVPGALQYFWEAFPAGSGPTDRTTYMFTYLDADPRRPSLEAMYDDYWRLMPAYQGVHLSDLTIRRMLFGFFPTYRESPLPPGFDRILQVGDASGIQSPLSFGGFGAMTRHLARLTRAVHEAVEADLLDKSSLALINAYNPGLSSAWMLQRAMSVRPDERQDKDLINRMLGANFRAMQARGDSVMMPFMQDVMKFGPFAQTVIGQMLSEPLFVPKLLQHVGPAAMLDWARHFAALGFYDAQYAILKHLRSELSNEDLSSGSKFKLRRYIDALEFGSGNDYHA